MNQAQIAAAGAAAAIALTGGAEAADVDVAARQAAAIAAAVQGGVAADAAVAEAIASTRGVAARQTVREEFMLGIAQAKAALNPQVVLMLMLYPCVIAFTIAARYTKRNMAC